MPDRVTKTQRWLDLIALLLGRKIPLTVEEIVERIPAYAGGGRDGDPTARASTRRMFERDKDELRKIGIPIETVRYEINHGFETIDGYRITRRDFYLPYLRIVGGDGGAGEGDVPRAYSGLPEAELDPAEAGLALDALRLAEQLPAFPFAEEARSALRKLTFDLDPERYPGMPVIWVERPGAREVLEWLRILSDALLARKCLRFVYHGIYRGEVTEREVAPFGLFFQRDWYLVGRDASREAVRVFRVSRMERVETRSKAPSAPDYEIPGDFDLRTYLDRSAWELGEESLVAEVLFHFPTSIQAALNGEGELVEERQDGSAVRRFAVSQVNPFLRWLLSLGGEAEILGPLEVKEEYRALVAETAAVYGGQGG